VARAVLGLLTVCGAFSPAARALAQIGPVGAAPLDARSSALSGAVTADVSGFAATVHNPAGLVRRPGLELGLAYAYREHALRVDGADSRVAGAHRFVAGLSAAGRVFEIPAGFGLSVQLPVAATGRRSGGARWERYDPRAEVMQLATAVALRPHGRLELGVGAIHLLGVSDRGAVRELDAGSSPGGEAVIGARSLPQAGLELEISPRVRLGLVLRGGAELHARLPEPSGKEVGATAPRTASALVAFVPPELVVGTSAQVSERIRLSFDVAYLGYASLEGPLVDQGGASPAPRRALLDDRVVPRIGLEWLMPGFQTSGLRIPVRAGYALERSPLRDDERSEHIVDTTRHNASVGCAVELPSSGLSVGVHASFGMLPERLRIVGDPRTLLSADGTQSDIGLSLSARMP
jgi:hypothetical protein